MPSLTVVFSSDTDIYISPGLYGDCLPTSSTAGAADSFRAEESCFHFFLFLPFMLAHVRSGEQRPPDRRRQGRGIHVTSTR
ncbi:hypothetical protein B6E66_09470 [Streptomyces maremycinicus]|nr:hypothetical protein B6E66_09470 [Streptomyces sp. B9173]